jgi:hypothetical protein
VPRLGHPAPFFLNAHGRYSGVLATRAPEGIDDRMPKRATRRPTSICSDPDHVRFANQHTTTQSVGKIQLQIKILLCGLRSRVSYRRQCGLPACRAVSETYTPEPGFRRDSSTRRPSDRDRVHRSHGAGGWMAVTARQSREGPLACALDRGCHPSFSALARWTIALSSRSRASGAELSPLSE